MKPRLLLLCFSPLRRDPRVLRQLKVLRDDYDVSTCGFGPAPDDVVEHYEIPDSSKGWWPVELAMAGAYVLTRQFARFYRNEPRVKAALELVPQGHFDVIIANDLNTVPLASMLRPTKGFHADLHEWEPRVPGSGPVWFFINHPYIQWQLRQLKRASSATTVAQGIADAYSDTYGVRAGVVTNAADYADLSPTETTTPLRIIHSGGASKARRIDVMIDAMRGVDNATLELMLVSYGDNIIETLKEYAAGMPNVTFREPVGYADLVTTLNDYDLGMHLLAPTSFNNKMALPNKLFEYVQARLGIIIGPSPEMARIVNEHDLGVVSDDFSAESLREVIQSLTAEHVAKYKQNSHNAAEALSSERAVQPWLAAVRAIAPTA
ncbi:glycosyltransferase [Arthrobacter flavus]|uniref:Glycosyltransferase n=1 Tax=Arthrobacter flavus TaxID=95172 RepID=A0ABW4QBB1_9MICC